MLRRCRFANGLPMKAFICLLATAVTLIAATTAWGQLLPPEMTAPMLGKPAPTFTLDLMDGGKLDLAALKGKIVVLDFWATWCPPCRATLPIYVKVTDKFKDKGVVFHGINIKETPDAVKAFQKKQDLKFSVAIDTRSDVVNLYGVEIYPQLVIVGKDGVVESVHVGMAPDSEAVLTKELETLVSGKSLVKKDEPKK
jgi:peroxiredoxin